MTLALAELLLLLPILYVNSSYFTGGFKSLVHGAPTMDALIAIGASASVAWSVYAMFVMADQLAAEMSTPRRPPLWTTCTSKAREPSCRWSR